MLRKWTDHAACKWLTTPLGESLLAQEARVVEEALDGIFGEELVQLGHWGEPGAFLRYSRTQRAWLVAEESLDGEDFRRFAIGQLHQLPIQDDSVDAVLLPHTLDYSDRPHAILREADRILRSDGHLIVLGFRPGGLWGLRRLIPGAGMPPGADHVVSDRRLRDWLQLLNMRIQHSTGYFFRWPLPTLKGQASPKWENRGRRWWPEVSACYLLTAQKRVMPLTRVRPVWRKKPQVVGSRVAEPSRRVTRIRFDPNG